LFVLWFRDRPEQKATVNDAELALIRQSALETRGAHAQIPWFRLLRSGNLWFLCVMYACQSYGWYFAITYLPDFFEQQYGLSKTSVLVALYKGGPLWMGAFGCLLGGILTDWFIRRTGNRRLGRKIFGAFGHGMGVLCFLACPYAPNAFLFFLAISLAGFFADLTMGSSWALCQDIGRRHAAIVAGCMNMVGNLGGFLATVVSGFVIDATLNRHAASLGKVLQDLSPAEKAAGQLPGYHINFFLFAAAFAVGVFCWLMVDSTKPVVPEEAEAHRG
jgi:nitrate/nitrite transporter NarK